MIKYVTGDMLMADVQAIVNTVNTVGVMGKGIALQFKDRFPNNYHEYVRACKEGRLVTGKLLVYDENTLTEHRTIINFPTKKDWKHPSKYTYIEDGLQELAKVIIQKEIKTIAIPPLGCGNGKLEWSIVKEMMERHLGALNDVEIFIYQPNKAIKEILKQQEIPREAKLTDSGAILLYLMFYYESLGEQSSLFVANKLAYFLKRIGESHFSRLTFVPSHYGPYCTAIGHMLHGLNGKYIKGLEQLTNKPFEVLELQYAHTSKISEYIKTQLNQTQRDKLRNVIDLISGFQSTFALELLASVDFVRSQHPGITKEKTVEYIRSWSERKKELMKEGHISIAFDHLEEYASGLTYLK